MQALGAARLGDQIGHGAGLVGLAVGAVFGAVAGAAFAAGTVASGGLVAGLIIAGSVGLGGTAANQLLKGIKTIFQLPDPTTGALAYSTLNVTVNGRGAMRAGVDGTMVCAGGSGVFFSHPPLPIFGMPGFLPVAEGSKTVRINAKPAGRITDRLICAGKITTASQDVRFGGPTENVAFVWDWTAGLEAGFLGAGLLGVLGGGAAAVQIGVAAVGGFALILGATMLGFEALGALGDSLGEGYRDLLQGAFGMGLLLAGWKMAPESSPKNIQDVIQKFQRGKDEPFTPEDEKVVKDFFIEMEKDLEAHKAQEEALQKELDGITEKHEKLKEAEDKLIEEEKRRARLNEAERLLDEMMPGLRETEKRNRDQVDNEDQEAKMLRIKKNLWKQFFEEEDPPETPPEPASEETPASPPAKEPPLREKTADELAADKRHWENQRKWLREEAARKLFGGSTPEPPPKPRDSQLPISGELIDPPVSPAETSKKDMCFIDEEGKEQPLGDARPDIAEANEAGPASQTPASAGEASASEHAPETPAETPASKNAYPPDPPLKAQGPTSPTLKERIEELWTALEGEPPRVLDENGELVDIFGTPISEHGKALYFADENGVLHPLRKVNPEETDPAYTVTANDDLYPALDYPDSVYPPAPLRPEHQPYLTEEQLREITAAEENLENLLTEEENLTTPLKWEQADTDAIQSLLDKPKKLTRSLSPWKDISLLEEDASEGFLEKADYYVDENGMIQLLRDVFTTDKGEQPLISHNDPPRASTDIPPSSNNNQY